MSKSDVELVSRARAGDPDALAAIYRRFHAPLYASILSRTGDPELAGELTSEVFARLMARINSLDIHKASLRSWLYVVARNLVTDYRRTHDPQRSQPLDSRLVAGEDTDPCDQAEARVLAAEVTNALARLTAAQRTVILLRFVEELSNAEIAVLLGKDEGAIKALQHRALASLRRALAGGEERKTPPAADA